MEPEGEEEVGCYQIEVAIKDKLVEVEDGSE
jgi:hypothetical protein